MDGRQSFIVVVGADDDIVFQFTELHTHSTKLYSVYLIFVLYKDAVTRISKIPFSENFN